MSSGSQPVEVVAELGRRFRSGDVEGAFALLHPDFRIQQPASLPHGGWHLGRYGMVQMSGLFAEHWGRTIGPPTISGCGDAVLHLTTQTWTAKATGRSETVDVVELIAVTDGLVREIRVFPQDTHRLMATLD